MEYRRPERGGRFQQSHLDKIASEWVGAEDWRIVRQRCQNAVDERDFVTFAFVNVKHSIMNRLNIGEHCQTEQPKEPITLGSRGCVVTATWLDKGSMGTTRWERHTKKKLPGSTERCILDERGVLRTPLGKWTTA